MNALPKTKASKPKAPAARPKLPLTKPIADPLVRQLIELLPSILHQNFSAEELAVPFNVSYSTLRHRFKAATGVALWYYVKWLRLETARQLLVRERLPVKKVLAQVGLRDLDNFRRDFRRAYGLAPYAYRECYGRNPVGH